MKDSPNSSKKEAIEGATQGKSGDSLWKPDPMKLWKPVNQSVESTESTLPSERHSVVDHFNVCELIVCGSLIRDFRVD